MKILNVTYAGRNMKAISFSGVISGVRSKVDKSLSLTVHTPELDVKERALFMELQGYVCDMFIKPQDEAPAEVVIDKEVGTKTLSQRLRNCIYRLYMLKKDSSEQVPEEFSDYYRPIMESFIEKTKQQMEEYE